MKRNILLRSRVFSPPARFPPELMIILRAEQRKGREPRRPWRSSIAGSFAGRKFSLVPLTFLMMRMKRTTDL